MSGYATYVGLRRNVVVKFRAFGFMLNMLVNFALAASFLHTSAFLIERR